MIKKRLINLTKKKNSSIKKKLMVTLCIGSILLLSLTGIIISFTVNNRFNESEKNVLYQATDSVNHEADIFFQRYKTIAEQMTKDKTLQNFLVSTKKGDTLDSTNSNVKTVMNTLTDIRKMEEGSILFAYIAEEDPSYYLDDSTGFSDPSFDLKSREYYSAIKNKEIYITEPHKEFSTNKMVITIAAPIYVNGNIEGLAALDITLDSLSQVVGNSKLGETGYFSLLSKNNAMTWHKDSDNILKQVDEIEISENLLQNIKNQNKEIIEYTYNNESFIGNCTEIGDTKWKVVSAMPMDEFSKNTKQIVNIIIIIYILTIMLLSALMYVIIGIVTKPIKNITDVTNKLANGELNVEININSNDELGELAKSIESLTERLKLYIVYIDESVQILDEFAKGNLLIEFTNDYDGEFLKLKNALVNVSETQKRVIKKIKDSSELISNNADQVSSGAQTLAQGTTEQASAIEELSAEINEVYETIVKNSEHAENAGKVAIESSAEVDKSNIKMNEMLIAMDAINNSSLEINKIIKVIDDIAFQTNILALNAAVEAARAGSAGKGFAVVADEVRNLAGKSSEAAKQTTTLIENSILAIKKGTTLADDTGKSLSGIVSKTKLTSDLITEIVHASSQQTVSINQIKYGIEQISSVIQENAATAEASAANSEELSGQSQILTDLVNQFNVDKSKSYS